MTLDEFFSKLRSVAQEDKPVLTDDGLIRWDWETYGGDGDLCACPITRVAKSVFPEFYEEALGCTFYKAAANQLEMTAEDRDLIIHAADIDGDCDPDIRRLLLEACGL